MRPSGSFGCHPKMFRVFYIILTESIPSSPTASSITTVYAPFHIPTAVPQFLSLRRCPRTPVPPVRILPPEAGPVLRYLMVDHTTYHLALGVPDSNARDLRILHDLRAATCLRDVGDFLAWLVHHTPLGSMYSAWIDSPLNPVKPRVTSIRVLERRPANLGIPILMIFKCITSQLCSHTRTSIRNACEVDNPTALPRYCLQPLSGLLSTR
ncbi:uncharacterized protein CC84DRAFT_770564 [Paraphaeosphaeria sporulosa]|uniref:Uncharacterized protein n=1 Tax=Paraphaeosphaeria sporulosa TaxID=1460663 RepID=A0A177CFU9_9PLEO|nr:uncharacterized protein CC84DRAFT_770564 [Paraphaeosphaeria sporulosa]OAG06485.1 hypothetical protein CC84DRAFT_770564 [Paraphaeosphaeria sporulosa]